MYANPRPTHLTIPYAPAGAALGFVVVAATFAAMPQALLDTLVVQSGVTALVGAAEPPLGATARVVLALACGGFAAAVIWAALFLLLGTRGLRVLMTRRPKREPGVPAVRRADAHPDAPPRRPIFANEDLGQPTAPMGAADGAEHPLPRNLDIPLAHVDPESIPDVPREPVRPVAALAPRPPLLDGERLATFTLTPPPPLVSDQPRATIESLLDRLERSARQGVSAGRGSPKSAGLDEVIASLRGLATP